jgi:protein-tyrosine phosphatase
MTRQEEGPMPWDTSYLPDLDAVLTVYGGVITAESLREAVEATVELGRRHGSTRFLADCSSLEGGHSVVDLCGLVHLIESAGVALGSREALVLPQLDAAAEDVHFWETACQNRGFSVRVFRTSAEARAWLARGRREPGASIAIASVPNLRDLGGWPTRAGGHVRAGLVYRSTELDKLAGADMAAFAGLGIRSVYDLRTEVERTAQPDRLPPDTEYVVIDVFKDSTDAAPAQLLHVASDPQAAEAMLGGGKAEKLFETGYREIVGLRSARTGYHRLFADLAHEEHRPALFHCTTGKDRTGWAAAALLMLLGVADDLVMEEYLLTNTQLLPAEAAVFEEFRAQGGDPELLRPVFGVAPEYLEAALDEMRRRFGAIEGYFTEGLGIGGDLQQTLREVFVARD